MNETIQEKIANVVNKDHGWRTDQVRIDEVEQLRHGSCSIYTAGHTVRPLSYQLNYAVLSDDTVLGTSDERVTSRILDACGSDAEAEWWAEIVTRFSKDLGQGVVLTNSKQNYGAMDQIKAAKKEFTAPKFSDEGGSKSVSFYVLEPEEFVVYWVKATRNKDGSVTVQKNNL